MQYCGLVVHSEEHRLQNGSHFLFCSRCVILAEFFCLWSSTFSSIQRELDILALPRGLAGKMNVCDVSSLGTVLHEWDRGRRRQGSRDPKLTEGFRLLGVVHFSRFWTALPLSKNKRAKAAQRGNCSARNPSPVGHIAETVFWQA